MGNRGTTPNWDDEQISKFGLLDHFRMTAMSFKMELVRRREKQVANNIDQVLVLLNDSSEETRARAVVAIPDVINALTLGNMAMFNWRRVIANRVYKDWFFRTGQPEPMPDFDLITTEDQTPFLEIVEAVVKSQDRTEAP